MNRSVAEVYIRKYFVYAIAAVSIIVTPRAILDPINAPKMLLLFILATIGIFLMFPHLGFYFKAVAISSVVRPSISHITSAVR